MRFMFCRARFKAFLAAIVERGLMDNLQINNIGLYLLLSACIGVHRRFHSVFQALINIAIPELRHAHAQST
jgi:hypothetical protein